MKEELQQRLWHRFSFMDGVICECGDGWYQLIYTLCVQIENVFTKRGYAIKDFTVLQVKEKFGGLRFYTGSTFEEIFALIERTERKSFVTCEVCGDPGEVQPGYWQKVRCEKHKGV